MSLLHHDVTREPFGLLSAFRAELYASMTGRADALFELTDAMLCAEPGGRSGVADGSARARAPTGARCGVLGPGSATVATSRWNPGS